MIDINGTIGNVPNWPVTGVQFKDITTLLSNPDAFRATVIALTDFAYRNNITDIVAPDARGFIWGAPVAFELGLPLHLVRKPGKLPPPVIEQSFSYEYDSTTLQIKADAKLNSLSNVLIVDDVSATGGTALAIIELLKQFEVQPANTLYSCVIDLSHLGGIAALQKENIQTFSVVKYESEN